VFSDPDQATIFRTAVEQIRQALSADLG
jgi:hypothetical protein